MLTINATRARNEWSSVLDSVIREKPRFIRRTRDTMILAHVSILENLLSEVKFVVDWYTEEDGSIFLVTREMDLIESGKDMEEAVREMAKGIMEYADIYYEDFDGWYSAPNRKPHLPYVLKALILNDIDAIGGLIECHPGEI